MNITFDKTEQWIADLVGHEGDLRSCVPEMLGGLEAPAYATDADGFIWFFNKACAGFFGRPPDIGRDRWHIAWKLYTAEGNYLPHDYTPIAAAIKTRRPVRGVNMVAARPDGSRALFAPFPTPLFTPAGEFAGALNILIPVETASGIADLQAQAERSRRLRFSVVDARVEYLFGQVAAAYEERITENTHAAGSRDRRTLGDVLYTKIQSPPAESGWGALVQSIAAGDRLALQALYERAHQLVSALITRITGNSDRAHELCIDVFHDVWRRAKTYDRSHDTVLGWIMTNARSRATAALRPAPAKAASDARNILVNWQPALRSPDANELDIPAETRWIDPEWEEVASGIECKLLASDPERKRISMLVRLAEGASYPAHTHAGVEELHLLDGELWIDERKLHAGDYNYGPPGAGDNRVFSDTGCTCLLITSTQDILH